MTDTAFHGAFDGPETASGTLGTGGLAGWTRSARRAPDSIKGTYVLTAPDGAVVGCIRPGRMGSWQAAHDRAHQCPYAPAAWATFPTMRQALAHIALSDAQAPKAHRARATA